MQITMAKGYDDTSLKKVIMLNGLPLPSVMSRIIKFKKTAVA